MSSAAQTTPKVCSKCGGRFGAEAVFCPKDGSSLTLATDATTREHPVVPAPAPNPRDFPTPDAVDPYVGREILGHIQIMEVAGTGAMGRVYRARQSGIDRDVAVKILHQQLSQNRELVARFHREAKVAAKLEHPNVVQVYMAGELPDGAMYIVMEYLDGLSLKAALSAASGAMPLARALHVALQLCDAVGEGHTHGIIHRD